MHDIDRTTRELETAMYEFQPEATKGKYTKGNGAKSKAKEFFTKQLMRVGMRGPAYETGYESTSYEGEMNEGDAYELAAELLEVTNEYELDPLLGKVIRRVRKLARSPIGRALSGVLKSLAKAAWLNKLRTIPA